MCHLWAMPGDPGYDRQKGMKAVVEAGRKDLLALQEGGVDAIMFSNEFSRPYLTQVDTVTVAAMARLIGELLPEIHIPFGVNVLWDAQASLDLAVAVGAKFIREVFTGAYASDFGLWTTNCGAVVRHQHAIGARMCGSCSTSTRKRRCTLRTARWRTLP
jgi:membrane complex biogenesis BtpA family protein